MSELETITYESPEVTFFSAQALNSITVTMSGGGSGGIRTPIELLNDFITTITNGSVSPSNTVMAELRIKVTNVFNTFIRQTKSMYGNTITRGNATSVYLSLIGLSVENQILSGVIRQYNYSVNQDIISSSTTELIDQANGTEGSYRYGVWTTNNNGCEIIALYNALLKLGENPDMHILLDYFEIYGNGRIMYGLFGTSPRGIADYLDLAEISSGLYAEHDDGTYEDFDEKLTLSNSNIGILTFWWGSDSWHIHTVLVEKLVNSVDVFNYDPWNGRYIINQPSINALVETEGIIIISLIVVDI